VSARPGSESLVYGGTATAGFLVGVLTLDTRYPLIPGNAQHAASFGLPILFQSVCVEGPELMRGQAELTPKIVEGARCLESQGVRVVVGACGSFAYYQRAVADALRIPAFMSIMLQVPMLQATLAPGAKLLVLCAKASALTERVFLQCGISRTDTLVIGEVAGRPTFDGFLAGRESLDVSALRLEVLDAVDSAVQREPSIAGIVLQCSDLPPFAADIQDLTGLPVFDVVLMIRWLAMASDYAPYTGSLRSRPLQRARSG
jgi:hypothetical protein